MAQEQFTEIRNKLVAMLNEACDEKDCKTASCIIKILEDIEKYAERRGFTL